MVGDAITYDPFTFRKHFKNIGRAYREQATTLIEICRLYGETYPQTYTENDGLQNILRLADAALSAAGKAKKGTTTEATEAFARLQEEIKRFGPPSSRKGAPGGHRKKLPDPSTALESASKKDKKSTSILSRVKSAFKAPIPSGNTKQVNFVILESLHEEHKDQLIINQEIDNSTTTAEIIASKQNPHFYLQLSKDAASFDSEFHKDPLKDFSHGLRQGDKIYVLLDKSCRLFLDATKPHIPHVGGILDSEDIVLCNIGRKQDYWHRPSITDPSQRPIQSNILGDDGDIINRPVENGRDLMESALRSQKVDLMIRDRSRPLPPADSGWKPLPSPVPSVRVQAPEDQITPRQSATRLPQLEYSNPNASASSIGGDTVFTTSTESFETAVNTSEDSLPMLAATGKRPQSIADSGIDLQLEVELPTAGTGTLSTPPLSAPPASLTIPSPLPGRTESYCLRPQFGSGKLLETGSRDTNTTMIAKAGGPASCNHLRGTVLKVRDGTGMDEISPRIPSMPVYAHTYTL
ncbi:hypothetical protein EDB84DRAFT_1571137 [Lactarius hengduanensis]|nr:hypothetical protein EDB84DRAFT_1571137 [Lactarius hengduanensis]